MRMSALVEPPFAPDERVHACRDYFNSSVYFPGVVLDCFLRHGDWRVIVQFDGGARPRIVQLDVEQVIRVDAVTALADLA
jgi:hypothetical protein